MTSVAIKEERKKAERQNHWSRIFESLPREHSFEPLFVEGEIPSDLKGTLYRNGPSNFDNFGREYTNLFDGDGAISAVRFDGKGISGAIKLVQTPQYLREKKAGKPIYSNYEALAPRWIDRVGGQIKNPNHTNVLFWENQVLALCEIGKPVALDPRDLSTIGETDLGIIPTAFSAHYHRVEKRKAIYNFGVRYGFNTYLDLFEFPDEGKARKITSIPFGEPRMLHDFIATPNYLLFCIPPVQFHLAKQFLGIRSLSENFEWKPELGTEIIVVPLDNPEKYQRFTVDPFFVFHFANAWEEEGSLHFDLILFPDFCGNDWVATIRHGKVPDNMEAALLYRAKIDLKSNTYSHSCLYDNLSCEFPKVAPMVEGNKHQYCYVASHSTEEIARNGLWNTITKCDVQKGNYEEFVMQEGAFVCEPLFAPRSEEQEDDGYLITFVYDSMKHASFVGILDAQDLKRGFVCKAWFDHHIPQTFHGQWIPNP